MDWEALATEFRSLGGIAENVKLDNGPIGRGIFVVDPSKPARLHASENLLFPLHSLELHQERLRVKPGALGERESAFFDAYQDHFGWSAGGYAYEKEMQTQWHALPSDVIHYIAMMGVLQKDEPRFAAPSIEVCMLNYLNARHFDYNGKLHLVPMIDLINHGPSASGYVYSNGIGVAGHGKDEVRVCYNICDAWGLAMTYGFAGRTQYAYSVGITVGLHDAHQLSVFRSPTAIDVRNGIAYPETAVSGNTVDVMNLMLGSRLQPAMPRTAFRATVQPWLATAQADETFDSIQHYNRTKFIELLRILRPYHGTLIDMLENAALNQLETLSAYFGTIATQG